MKIDEILSEASTPRRAWEGKLKNVDSLLAWMYEKDILTKTEKAKKDVIFRQYYRYYNDGDMPKALSVKGFSKFDAKHNPDKLEAALEEYLETFIKELLGKYLPKIDREEFRLDKWIADLATVIRIADEYDFHGLLTYWLKNVRLRDPELKLKEMVDKLQGQYDKLKEIADEYDRSSSNYTMSYRRDQLLKDKKWTDSAEKLWKEACKTTDEITEFLENLSTSLKRLKKEHLRSEDPKKD